MDFPEFFSGKTFCNSLIFNDDFQEISGLADGIGFFGGFLLYFCVQIVNRNIMNTRFKITVAIALVLLFGAKVFGQEWEYSIEYSMDDDECFELYDAVEMSNGNVALSSSLYYKSGAGDFYSAHPAVTLLSANGQEMARKDYFRPGYCTTSYAPYLFENNGRLFALMT